MTLSHQVLRLGEASSLEVGRAQDTTCSTPHSRGRQPRGLREQTFRGLLAGVQGQGSLLFSLPTHTRTPPHTHTPDTRYQTQGSGWWRGKDRQEEEDSLETLY